MFYHKLNYSLNISSRCVPFRHVHPILFQSTISFVDGLSCKDLQESHVYMARKHSAINGKHALYSENVLC